MMILQPDFVPDEVVHRAIQEVAMRKKLPATPRLRLAEFHEGRCAQILHVGPFTEEGPTIGRASVHRSPIREKREAHEIYLGDIRRAAPEKWKTILRQPME
jgi:hypothetical protein